MKKIIKFIKHKWIDGQCRKLCCLCPYWERICKADLFPNNKYTKGYAQGYEDGYTAGKKIRVLYYQTVLSDEHISKK